MGFSHQGQKAGDNAQQIQAGTIIINNGISEERVRAIFSEMQERAIQEYTQDAYEKANERIQELEKALAPLVERNEENLSFFADPAFQIALKKAQISAAKTDSKDDYDLLAELLDEHIKFKNSRIDKVAVEKAIEVVSDIDNNALCALTLVCAIMSYKPTSGSIKKGINIIDNLYKKLTYMNLPEGKEWLYHLDISDVMRVSGFGTMKKYTDYIIECLDGYVCTGIDKNSGDYEKAIKILNDAKIHPSILVDHELMDNYVRLSVRSKYQIDTFITEEYRKNSLKSIFDLYSKDNNILNNVKNEFVKYIMSFKNITLVQEWWDKIPSSFDITRVGYILAQTNIQRIDAALPKLNLS